MKKITILGLSALALGLSFTSCNKDDDSGSSAAAVTVEGKWNFSKQGAVMDGHEMLIDYMGNEDGCTKDFITVNANGSVVETDYDSSDNPCELFTYNGSYAKSGNTLSITWSDEGIPQVYEILTLDASTLKLKDASDNLIVFVR